MKDIKGYEGLYAVTSCGKVWSYRRKKFLKPYDNGFGYLQVDLIKDNNRKKYRVNRLVAEAYITNPNPESYDQVGHKDEIRHHNWVENLYWTNAKENSNYGLRNARVAKALSKPVYCEELNRVFESGKVAAASLGLHQCNISNCCNGKLKTTGGYHWRFATEEEINTYNLNKSLDELTDAIVADLALERVGLEVAC